jgi:hypothetical protein
MLNWLPRKQKGPTTISGCRTKVFQANFLSLDSLNQSNGFWHISSYPVCQRAKASCPAGRLQAIENCSIALPEVKDDSRRRVVEKVPCPNATLLMGDPLCLSKSIRLCQAKRLGLTFVYPIANNIKCTEVLNPTGFDGTNLIAFHQHIRIAPISESAK